MCCRALLSYKDKPDPLEDAGSYSASMAGRILRAHPLHDHNSQMEESKH